MPLNPRLRVLERLSQSSAALPDGVVPYLAPDATALGQIFWYTVEGDGRDPGELRAIQDWYVRYQLYSVPGVAEVASVGGFPIEYQIDIDPNKLRAYNVTLGEVYSAVARSNASVGGRIVQKANSEYLVRSAGWIQSLDDVKKIVIKSSGGTPVYVSNVASVQFGSSMRRVSPKRTTSARSRATASCRVSASIGTPTSCAAPAASSTSSLVSGPTIADTSPRDPSSRSGKERSPR